MLKLYGITPMSLFATFVTFLMAALSAAPILAVVLTRLAPATPAPRAPWGSGGIRAPLAELRPESSGCSHAAGRTPGLPRGAAARDVGGAAVVLERPADAVARMPAETPAARGRRLVDALIVWITPDGQLERGMGGAACRDLPRSSEHSHGS